MIRFLLVGVFLCEFVIVLFPLTFLLTMTLLPVWKVPARPDSVKHTATRELGDFLGGKLNAIDCLPA